MTYTNENELYHYGVPGMKWGKRKARPSPTTDGSAKKAYEKAKAKTAKARDERDATKTLYNKAFNRAYNKNHPYSLSREKRQASDKRWEEVADKAKKLNTANSKYKAAKKAEKAAKKMAKAEAKAVKKAYRKQYMQGQSAAGKVWAKLTDLDRYYAESAYKKNKGVFNKNNKVW
jgi:hypothetical protein